MTGFKRRTSGIVSDLAANRATTAAQHTGVYLCCMNYNKTDAVHVYLPT